MDCMYSCCNHLKAERGEHLQTTTTTLTTTLTTSHRSQQASSVTHTHTHTHTHTLSNDTLAPSLKFFLALVAAPYDR